MQANSRTGRSWVTNRRVRCLAGVALVCLIATAPASAQHRVSLPEAVAAAEANAPRIAAAKADSAAAQADVVIARAFPNPNLSLGYSKSVPRHHVELEQPLEYPGLRSARIEAARMAAHASEALLDAERASVRHDAEVAYVRAVASEAAFDLSRQNSHAAQELLRIARARQKAGDASDLDVELAEITIGQLRATMLTDSLTAVNAKLDLQTLMGLPLDSVVIAMADSLNEIPLPVAPHPATALRISAARSQADAQAAQLAVARRSRIPVPAIRVGFEQGDPSEKGLLPTLGIAIPSPIFYHGSGEVNRARAEADRARADLAAVERETAAALASAARQRDLARQRIAVDRAMVDDARRVAALSLRAYQEGAYPLASVLEAQRNARDALRQLIDDLQMSFTAEAALQLARTAGGPLP
ncbi:MAG TPA: TolC family protein [Rhodothermales bacterium]|nr:TolC family protein [Rhodothermales bacterium]